MKFKNFIIFVFLINFVFSLSLLADQKTVDPVNWRKLVPFLGKIKGWEALREASGSSVSTDQFKMSQARRSYKSNDKKLKIEIIDGGFFPMAYAGFKAMQNFQIDSSEQLIKKTKISGFTTIEQFNYKRNRATLLILVAERFLVQLEEKNVKDTSEIKKIAESLELKKLAKLAK